MGLKREIKVDGDHTQQQVGAEFILSVFENLHLADLEVIEFLADLSGIDPEEFPELPIEKTIEILNEFKSLPGISSFFKSANQ